MENYHKYFIKHKLLEAGHVIIHHEADETLKKTQIV